MFTGAPACPPETVPNVALAAGPSRRAWYWTAPNPVASATETVHAPAAGLLTSTDRLVGVVISSTICIDGSARMSASLSTTPAGVTSRNCVDAESFCQSAVNSAHWVAGATANLWPGGAAAAATDATATAAGAVPSGWGTVAPPI